MSSLAKRNKKARQNAVNMKLEELAQWYVYASGGKMPDHLCEDKKTYRGKVLRWFEPPISATPNPVLIEEAFGDSWTLRIEKMAGT